MTVFHSLARRTPQPDVDSLPLALEELKGRLRRRADETIASALAIECELLAGRKRAEIQPRLGLTDDEYRHANRWLREELSAMRDN